jgi:predicted membrane protein
MRTKIINFVILAALAYGVYFLMANHIFLLGKDVEFRKKEKLTFTNTFNSYASAKEVSYIGLAKILAEDDLRNAGLGELLVEKELATQEDLDKALEKLDSNQ